MLQREQDQVFGNLFPKTTLSRCRKDTGTAGQNTQPVVLEKELLWAMNKARLKDIATVTLEGA